MIRSRRVSLALLGAVLCVGVGCASGPRPTTGIGGPAPSGQASNDRDGRAGRIAKTVLVVSAIAVAAMAIALVVLYDSASGG